MKKKEEALKNIKKPLDAHAVNWCRGGRYFAVTTTTHDTVCPIRGHY